VEPGESLEECVVREIKEEVGIDVTDVRYFASQPWPFPHSLMIGFRARYVGGDLVLQEEEIVDAGWFRADDLPPSPRGGMSIAGWLIEAWLEEQAARRS
jgi:NAD+ diphosphatase